MIPRLTDAPPPLPLYVEFLTELRVRGFEGDLSPTYADRTVLDVISSEFSMDTHADKALEVLRQRQSA